MLTTHQWQHDTRNPIFPPSDNWFDCTACMNPFVLRVSDDYYLFYAGGDKDHGRRICLAIASVDDITQWKRLGPILELGKAGNFDEFWNVLPCVHFINDRWHLYFTGRKRGNNGLQDFCGMGLAQSDDLIHWERYSDEPILSGDEFAQWPDNKAIAGGGRIIEIEANSEKLYRMHYTLPCGTPNPDRRIDQEKHSAIVHSRDGINWFDKRIILSPRAASTYEDCATIALNVWKTPKQWRAVYAGIGTRFAAYSICEAVSEDGLNWHRGEPEENLVLPPQGDGWESQMTAYPNVVEEDGKLRLFYCGNGYGATGIGTAVAGMVD